ncbi:hypothetical protein AXG93_723s1060 [Marchantia polymorpha subsp. ruderalis]|uniref:Dof-type domain-containing protein n=1 Tax=Marchantia polymorpha subsp. ruderalis TaxID=1480154 RepID=A0A176VBN2_MARPO|nr:hypothetical protein AXG93_723s1060 [Marchantia polymorpha subsp. ruderalis]
MLLSGCASEQHAGDSVDGSQSLLHPDKKTNSNLFAQRALQERRLKPPDQIIACPRCQSLNTKFCYYNNYSLTQPRHFCKNCRRYWTAGGTLRNVPVGGGCRKNKRAKQRSSDLSSVLTSVESSGPGMRNDGGGSALHPAYNPGSASSSASYFEQQYDLDPAKMALRQSIRAGPSGVSQSTESGISSNGHVSAFSGVTHGSQAGGMSHSAQSTYESAGIMSLGGFYTPVKQDVAALASGDLSAIFDNPHAHVQSFRAAAAAAAAAGAGPALGEEAIGYQINLEHLNGAIDPADVNVQWRLQAAAAQKQQQQQQQQQGKSAILSPSSAVDEVEPVTTRSLIGSGGTIWQPVPESLQPFEPVSHDSTFWGNQNWPPLGDLHPTLNGNSNSGGGGGGGSSNNNNNANSNSNNNNNSQLL